MNSLLMWVRWVRGALVRSQVAQLHVASHVEAFDSAVGGIQFADQ